jgi:hypothetical protein
VVAKTFRSEDIKNGIQGFYLRDLFDNFRLNYNKSLFMGLDNITFLRMVAMVVNRRFPEDGIINITDRYLNNIKSNHIENVWDNAKEAMLKVFDFFDNCLHIKGPALVPYGYFYMTLVTYFLENKSPDYNFLENYFWFNSFHNDDLLSNTTQLWNHVNFLQLQKENKDFKFDRFLIDRHKLRTSFYSSRGRYSRAILAFYANHMPKDWIEPYRYVITDVYYALTDKPNLHHIFPLNFIEKNPGKNQLNPDSLMNIAYLTQITNLKISDDNPIDYLKLYDNDGFYNILLTHLMPAEILEWAKRDKLDDNSLDNFIELRMNIILNKLELKLKDISFEVIDTKEI